VPALETVFRGNIIRKRRKRRGKILKKEEDVGTKKRKTEKGLQKEEK
jgi:hypothetical protein